MQAEFWHQKWKNNEIGFHANRPNPWLVKYIEQLELAPAARIFLPLCGKTLDVAWLLSQGFQVVGAELNQLAVEQLFDDLGIVPKIDSLGALSRYSAQGVDIFLGDIFEVTQEIVGSVDAIYDRAALVALPKNMRRDYAQLLMKISQQAKQLLITFTYDQSQMDGPPFSISQKEINTHYVENYHCELLECSEVDIPFPGLTELQENIWLVKPRK